MNSSTSQLRSSEGTLICSLNVRSGTVPSFKNRKRAILHNRTGKLRTLTPKKIKKRMDDLEEAILFALYSYSLTRGSGTDSECLKQLRTALSGLSDDSVREIPEFSFGVEHVPKGEEGVRITIEARQGSA